MLLAKSRNIAWPIVMGLYFVSDVILACIFEPLMLLVLRKTKRFPAVNRFTAAFKQATMNSLMKYGVNPGPFALILFSFGVDPMSGRIAAHAVGHRFIAGWAIAIAGDMIFFTVIMISTLWLNNILGDGTWTAVIVLAAMFIVPAVIQRLRRAPSA